MKIFFDKKGFIIENYKSKFYIIYFFIKMLVFLFDYLIPFLLTYIIWFFVKKSLLKWILIILLPYFIFTFYNAFSLIALKGRTIGMFFAKLKVADKGGGGSDYSQKWIRAISSGFYSIPIIGWFLIVVNLVTSFLWKGRTIIDTLSNTTIISNKLFLAINIKKEDF